jgi:large subunit ribosomal protein L13
VLGRLATDVARLILGKHRLDFTRHQVAPVFVIVTNTDKVALTGRKEEQKLYQHFTGYPGGLKSRPVAKQRTLDSRRIVWEAVFGMLPKNSLRAERMNHLKLYAEAEHPHEAQLKASI